MNVLFWKFYNPYQAYPHEFRQFRHNISVIFQVFAGVLLMALSI